MSHDRQRQEVDQNYDAFQRLLTTLLVDHRDRYAVMHARQIVEIVDTPAEAFAAGKLRYPEGHYSIQEITDEPIDLGFFSHVAH